MKSIWKAMLTKQFMELNHAYFQDRKTGKFRSKGGIIGYVILFFFLFISVASAFVGLGAFFCDILHAVGFDWLYFSIFSVLAALLGIIGSVFTTYSGLYRAKDNELLLSMPIPTKVILAVRLLGVAVTAVLYTALGWFPGAVFYWIRCRASAGTILASVGMFLLLSLLVITLTCLLGWIVALIAQRIRSKAVITVIFVLLFLGLYYVCYFRMQAILQSMAEHIDEISAFMERWGGLFYWAGQGAAGSGKHLLYFAAAAIALFALCYWVLDRTFVRLATAKASAKRKTYDRAESRKTDSVSHTLLDREWRRFAASSTYMLNCGMGVVIMPVLAIVLFIKRADIHVALDAINGFFPPLLTGLPVVVTALLCLISSMNAVAVPSVSLEGKSFWIIRSMPVATWDVLRAKLRLQVLINALPTVLVSVVVGILLRFPPLSIVLSACFCWMFVWFCAAWNLRLGLKKADLVWTNEVVPIKQNTGVLIAIFGGWGICIGFGAVYIVLAVLTHLSGELLANAYLVLGTAIFGGLYLLLTRWLKTKGTAMFEEL